MCRHVKPIPAKYMDGATISLKETNPLIPRASIQALLGARVTKGTPPYPSMTDLCLKVYGALIRLIRHRERPKHYRNFREFNRVWLRNKIIPCEADTFSSDLRERVEWWLALTQYTEEEKKMLREVMEDYLAGKIKLKELFNLKSHMKPEFYMVGMKPARMINSRVALAKIVFGPYIKAIEMRVFQLPYFIKKIPLDKRVEYMQEHVVRAGCKYVIGDYTSYEASFNKWLMDACELQVIAWVGQNLPHFQWFFKLFRKATTGMNKCQFRQFEVCVRATRMTGEMSTSLCNGITNLLVIQYVGSLHGLKEVPCVIEGDDSAQAIPLGSDIQAKDYNDLGFEIKLDTYDNPFEGGFCGMVMDPVTGVNCPNPSNFVTKIFWAGEAGATANRQKQALLLSAKALSAAVTYPGAPIVGSVARACLRMAHCEKEDVVDFIEKGTTYYDKWEKETILSRIRRSTRELVECPVNVAARSFVERKFNMSVGTQLQVESFFDKVNAPGEFDISGLLTLPADYLAMEDTVRSIPAGFPIGELGLLANERVEDPRKVFPNAPWK